MRYRKLGRSGVTVSVVGLGTWQFGGEWGKRFSQAEVDSLLRRAAELGVNLIDTAECYGDHLSESLIGRAIARNRDSWIVATKFGHRFHADRIAKANWDVSELRTDAWSPREVVAQLDASLRALQTDYVDVYQSHGGQDAPFNSPQLWETLQQEVAKGKIRHLGISLDATDVDQTKLAPGVNADVIQVTYNRLNRVAEEGVLPACAHADLGVLAREPLANGYLSGTGPGTGSPAATTGAPRTTPRKPMPSCRPSATSKPKNCPTASRWRNGRSPGRCSTMRSPP
jgi:aryl-alcohol dehydrogenase-like predicted oxidoreductase